jgi:hypothetical protein
VKTGMTRSAGAGIGEMQQVRNTCIFLPSSTLQLGTRHAMHGLAKKKIDEVGEIPQIPGPNVTVWRTRIRPFKKSK